jgi:drug/metabolite transporter (DMT)-like permease
VPSKQNLLPLAGVFSGALVWGLIWYPYRILQEAGVSGALATLLTYMLALLYCAAMLPNVGRELRLHHRAGMSRWMLVLALSVGWTNLGYVLAVLYGEVMRVLLLFYLAPLWTVLFSRWLLDERLNRYGYLIIALSLGGAFVMLWEPQLGLPMPADFAEWIGLSAGMAFALSNVVSRRSAHLSVEAKSCSVWFGTALLTAPLLLWQGELPAQLLAIDMQTWLYIMLIGAVICAVSFAVQYALAHLSANRAIVLFLFELVFAAVSAYILAGEAMGLRDWAGAALIVSASLLSGKLHAGSKYTPPGG